MSMFSKTLVITMAAGAGMSMAVGWYGPALFSSLICFAIVADGVIEALKK